MITILIRSVNVSPETTVLEFIEEMQQYFSFISFKQLRGLWKASQSARHQANTQHRVFHCR
ncbi:hypothetical protein HDV62DRAFT_366845 [Trichoderma sp. SZMC 28011]